MHGRYTVMRTHNAESQHGRGLLCGYAVMRASHGHVCRQAGVCVCVHVCVCDVRITA